MATDIVDKDLKGLRNARWDKAFKGVEEDEDTDVNRKATIVVSPGPLFEYVCLALSCDSDTVFFRLSI